MTVDEGQNKLESYDREDRKILLDLLNEYSEKVSNVCTEIDMLKQKQKERRVAAITINAFVCAFTFTISTTPGLILERRAGAFLMVFLIVVAMGILLNNRVYRRNGRRAVGNFEAKLILKLRTLSRKLEKIIQIVSQIQEHAPAHLASRIEMDFRLADAEMVLELASSYEVD